MLCVWITLIMFNDEALLPTHHPMHSAQPTLHDGCLSSRSIACSPTARIGTAVVVPARTYTAHGSFCQCHTTELATMPFSSPTAFTQFLFSLMVQLTGKIFSLTVLFVSSISKSFPISLHHFTYGDAHSGPFEMAAAAPHTHTHIHTLHIT